MTKSGGGGQFALASPPPQILGGTRPPRDLRPCLEHHYCEVAFTYFKVKFAKCICLLPMVLASWQRLKWSCEADLTKPQRVTGGVDGGEACGWS